MIEAGIGAGWQPQEAIGIGDIDDADAGRAAHEGSVGRSDPDPQTLGDLLEHRFALVEGVLRCHEGDDVRL